MATETKKVYTYNNDGTVASETTTVSEVSNRPVEPKPYVFNVRMADSPEWVAQRVVETLRRELLGTRYFGAEIKVTRE